jgi:hypothetical protein
MEVVCSSETSGLRKATRGNIPEDSIVFQFLCTQTLSQDVLWWNGITGLCSFDLGTTRISFRPLGPLPPGKELPPGYPMCRTLGGLQGRSWTMMREGKFLSLLAPKLGDLVEYRPLLSTILSTSQSTGHDGRSKNQSSRCLSRPHLL